MAFRRTTRGRNGRGPTRTSQWISMELGETTLAGGTLNLVGSLNAAALLARPFTIVRTRIECYYSSDQTAASETPFGSFGIIVASDKAVALGVTGVPQPITQADGDWFVWQSMVIGVKSLTSVGVEFNTGHHYAIDSKAMRKVGADEDIAVCFEQVPAATAVINIAGRMLIKLH